MKLIIKNLWGCQEATLDIEQGSVFVVRGKNESGKTSLKRALEVLLTGETNPLGLTATRMLALTAHHGNSELAEARLVDDDGNTIAEWQPGLNKYEWYPDVPQMTSASVSGEIMNLSGKKASEAWQAVIGGRVGQEELKAAFDMAASELSDQEARDKITAGLIANCLAEKWDNAERVAEGNVRAYKARWSEEVARGSGVKQNYGKKIAANFLPQNWSEEYAGMSIADAKERITQARSAMSKFEGGRVADERDKERFEKAVKEKETLTETLRKVQSELTAKRKEHEELSEATSLLRSYAATEPAVFEALVKARAAEEQAKENLEKLIAASEQAESAPAGDTAPCPACGTLLEIGKGKLIIVEHKDTDEEVATARKAFDAAKAKREEVERDDAKLAELYESLDGFTSKAEAVAAGKKKSADLNMMVMDIESLTKKETDAQIAVRARARVIDEFAGVEFDDPANKAEREAEHSKANEALRIAEEAARLIECKIRADELHRMVVLWENLKKLVGAGGIRAEVAARAVGKLNDILRTQCERADWSLIQLDPALWRLTIDGQDAAIASGSARWRAMAAVNIAVAYLFRSPICALDGADILVGVKEFGDTWNGLIASTKVFAGNSKVAVLITTAADVEADAEIVEGVIE